MGVLCLQLYFPTYHSCSGSSCMQFLEDVSGSCYLPTSMSLLQCSCNARRPWRSPWRDTSDTAVWNHGGRIPTPQSHLVSQASTVLMTLPSLAASLGGPLDHIYRSFCVQLHSGSKNLLGCFIRWRDLALKVPFLSSQGRLGSYTLMALI